MTPRCHQSKKEAVFQLCNFLCSQSVSQITDLANGEILYNTIQARFPPFPQVNVDPCDVLRNTEFNGVKNENSENESNPATKDIFLQHIKKFIDDHYNIKSETIITYEKCFNGDEFEVVKVTIFILSEIINLVLKTKSEDLQTLFHIDLKFQFELESIFKLFITERENLNKEEVEKLLTRKSKKVSPFTTPRRTSTRHKEQLLEYGTPKEDIFTNSPLKTYFESPVFKKQAVWMDEKMQYYEKTLEEGEEQVTNMENKITKLEDDLKNKEKSIKCLLKKLDEKEEENQNILRDIESLKAQQESTSKELASKKTLCEFLEIRVTELNSQIDDLNSKLDELSKTKEETSSVKRRSSSQLYENSFLKSKEDEIALLKSKVKNLEIKNYSYKKELADKILTELDRKKSPGARNQSYEEIWQTQDLERRKREELLSTIIDADNKELSEKLNSAQHENQRLLKEIENLKKKLAGKSKKSGTNELKDSSQTSDTEQFRKSFNETSFILNNSDYLIPCEEQSVISSEPEVLPCSQKSSEAVLWKMYDSQKLETENTYDINLNHDSVIPENSNLDVINDFQLSNLKLENIEPDNLLNQDNNYVLGNLNFNDFLNELKKLTKNGSFQKVLQVFGKRQKEMYGINGCKRFNIQDMLKMITECLAVTLNTESSLCDQIDKCCSTDVKELSTVIELNSELHKLKNQLHAVSQRHESDFKVCKSELEELMQEKIKLENKYQTSVQVISEKKRAFEDLCRKYRDALTKTESLNRKYCELKKKNEEHVDLIKKREAEYWNLRKMYSNINKRKQYYEKQHKITEEENTKWKNVFNKIKEENEKLLKEKKAWKVGSDSYLRDSSVGMTNYLNIKSDAYQDTANESVLSGAFHKNISHYVSENEDDFCYYNSLNPINKEDDRVEELKRRNSFYPRQLQSSYPLEVDLNATYHSLYVQDKCREQQHSKKLKLGDVITEEPSLFETPISKPKKKLETPSSFKRLMSRVKNKRISTKPKKPS